MEENSFLKIKSSEINQKYISSPCRMISCIEISNSYFDVIQCFYIDINKFYVISLFNPNSLDLIQTERIDNSNINNNDGNSINYDFYFYKNIYLKDEISIFSYMLDSSSDLIYIKIKQLLFNEEQYILKDYLETKPIIEINSNRKYTFWDFYYASNLIKINDYRFSLITTSRNKYELYIILFDLYNSDSNIFIRYYHIPLKLYYLRLFQYFVPVIYNGFLGLAYAEQKFYWKPVLHYF